MDKLRKALQDAYKRLTGIDDAAKAENRDLTVADYEAKTKICDEIKEIQNHIEIEERSAKTIEDLTRPLTENPDANMKSDESKKEFRSFGEFLQAVHKAGVPHTRQIDPRLEQRSISGLGEAAPAEAGFLVGTDFSAELIKIAHDTGLLASKCRHVPISANSNSLKMNGVDESSRVTGSRWGGIRVYRQAEATQVSSSKPKFKKIEIKLEKLMGLYYADEEILQDAAALGAIVSQAFGEEFGFKLDDEIINGSGAGECLGILNSTALVSQAKETGQAAKTIDVNNLIKMYSRLHSRSKGNAVWLINSDVLPQLFTMSLNVGTGGVPLFVQPGGIANAPGGSILGRPIMEIEQCATLGTVGDIILVDLSQYLLVDKGGIQAAESIHIRFDYAEDAFRFIWRTNGQPLWSNALTPYKGSATVSPYVVLATRA